MLIGCMPNTLTTLLKRTSTLTWTSHKLWLFCQNVFIYLCLIIVLFRKCYLQKLFWIWFKCMRKKSAIYCSDQFQPHSCNVFWFKCFESELKRFTNMNEDGEVSNESYYSAVSSSGSIRANRIRSGISSAHASYFQIVSSLIFMCKCIWWWTEQVVVY